MSRLHEVMIQLTLAGHVRGRNAAVCIGRLVKAVQEEITSGGATKENREMVKLITN